MPTSDLHCNQLHRTHCARCLYDSRRSGAGCVHMENREMAATFKIFGPFHIPLSGEYNHSIEVGCPAFWKDSETKPLAKERGCYLFAIRAAKGFRPIYVGKTKKSFEQECFTYHKIAQHYTPALDFKK